MTLPLDAAVAAFLRERKALGRADLKHPRHILRLLSEVVAMRLGEGRALVVDVTPEDLWGVIEDRIRLGLSAVSVSHAATALRAFCRWLVKRGALLLDPAEDLVVASPVRRVGYVPTPAEVERLIACAEPESALLRQGLLPRPSFPLKRQRIAYDRKKEGAVAEALRDRALLEFLYGSGLRFGEACALNVVDVDLSERTVFIKRGKGKKDRVVPLTNDAVRAILTYLRDGRGVLVAHTRRGTAGTPALLLTALGRRLSPWWTKWRLAPLLRQARLPSALTPHRLRHACAVHLLESGADVVMIARLLGHDRIGTTALYLSLTTASVDGALLKAHPRERADERLRRCKSTT